MSAIFPSAIATTLQMLQALNNTKVTLNADAGVGDTTITVDDPSPLPTSGYLTFADHELSPETIYYTGKAGSTLTGVTRGADSSAAGTHVTGAGIELRWNAAYHNTLATEIIAVEQNLSDRFGLSATQILAGAGSVTAPSYSKTGDLNTGIYFTGADAIDFTTGGTRAVGVNSSQQLLLPKTTNQIIFGTTNLVTISAAAPSASRVVTIADPGADAYFVMTQGTQTIVGGTTFSTALTINPTTNQLVLGVTRTVTISATQPASASRTWTIPDIGADGTFASLTGTQTFSGAKTFSATLTMSGATIAMGGNKITGLANGTTAGDALVYGQTIPFVGTTTNDDAAAGYVGEYKSVTVSAFSAPATGTFGDAASLALTGGDWWIVINGSMYPNSASIAGDASIGFSTASGNSFPSTVRGLNYQNILYPATTTLSFPMSIAGRLSLSAPATCYLKFTADYTSGTAPQFYGAMQARRVR